MPLTRKKKLELAAELEKQFGLDKSVIEYEFEDGWSIRRCLVYGDMCREGELMSNCWANSFWHQESKQRQWPGGAGMVEHFIGESDNVYPLSRDPESKLLTPTKKNCRKKLKRKRYFSLRDPDNLPRVSFFGEPKKGYVRQASAAHNASVKPQCKKYLKEFAQARGDTYWG